MPTSVPETGSASRSRRQCVARGSARLAAVGAVTAAAYYVVFEVVQKPPLHGFFDLQVYRGAVLWWLQGEPLYAFALEPGPKGFTYPPFAAIVMVPLTWLPAGPAAILVLLASAVVVVLVTWWLVAPVARRHGTSPWFAVALAVPVVLASEPIRETLGEGQLNMFIFALVLADVVALRRGRAWAGVGIGLAAALKLTPALFLVFLVLIGRRRPRSSPRGRRSVPRCSPSRSTRTTRGSTGPAPCGTRRGSAGSSIRGTSRSWACWPTCPIPRSRAACSGRCSPPVSPSSGWCAPCACTGAETTSPPSRSWG